MFPAATRLKELPVDKSIRVLEQVVAEQEVALFGASGGAEAAFGPEDDPTSMRRALFASWSGDLLPRGLRIAEVPDPGVVLCLCYDQPRSEASLPSDVFAQTLRRFSVRDPALRQRFDEHMEEAGIFVPPWLSREALRQRSFDALSRALGLAREQGFAHAVPLLEAIRGDAHPQAQVTIALYELRELGDRAGARRRLDEVLAATPRAVPARMQRAQLLLSDPSTEVEAATDLLVVLRELAREEGSADSGGMQQAAAELLWGLCRKFGNPRKLEQAVQLAQQEPERGFEVLSHYLHTHPCAWDAHVELAAVAIATKRFDQAAKLLTNVRWLYPNDANPHYLYGQALVMHGQPETALAALRVAERMAPGDGRIQHWIRFAAESVAKSHESRPYIDVAAHVARTLLVVFGRVKGWEVTPVAKRLPRVPGDVSLLYVVQAISSHASMRTGRLEFRAGEVAERLESVSERMVLFDWSGAPLDTEATVGSVPDPGVVLALFYEDAERDPRGRILFDPPKEDGRSALLEAASSDQELAWKIARHLRSPDATLLARLDEVGPAPPATVAGWVPPAADLEGRR